MIETSGEPLLAAIVLDISERKQAEEELKKSEEKYRFIFKRNPQPMWIINPETLEVMDVNEEAVRHYGYSRDEFKSMKISDFNIDLNEETLRNITHKPLYKYETRHQKKDGSNIEVEISATSKEVDGDTFRIVLVNDVTEKKKAREQIISSVIEGEDRERKRIARELHDGIGQYLTAANMNLEAIKKDITELSEKRKNQFSKGLGLVKESINEIRNISQNLMPKAIEDYGLVKAIEALVENYENSTDIKYSFNNNLEEELLGEQEKLNIYRIVQEAVHNAVKHAECTKIFIQLYQEDHMVFLTVEDNGVGLSFSGNGNGEDRNGHGLGLQSIRSRTKAMSASISFDSAPQKGTVVFLWVPIKNANAKK